MPANTLAAAAALVLVPASALAVLSATSPGPDRMSPNTSVTKAQPAGGPGAAPPKPPPDDRSRADTPAQPYRTSEAAPLARDWRWPLSPNPAVVRGFTLGPYAWSPGHRGVDLASHRDQPVLAPANGVVTFTRTIVGRPVLVITHAGGIRTSYEPVAPAVASGSAVTHGSIVGRVTAAPGHCRPRTCLHWGARRGNKYLDPLSLLRPPRIVLLPVPSGAKARDG